MPSDRSETNLNTLTDHPRFVTSPLRVFSNEARESDVSVLESITQIEIEYMAGAVLYKNIRTCEP